MGGRRGTGPPGPLGRRADPPAPPSPSTDDFRAAMERLSQASCKMYRPGGGREGNCTANGMAASREGPKGRDGRPGPGGTAEPQKPQAVVFSIPILRHPSPSLTHPLDRGAPMEHWGKPPIRSGGHAIVPPIAPGLQPHPPLTTMPPGLSAGGWAPRGCPGGCVLANHRGRGSNRSNGFRNRKPTHRCLRGVALGPIFLTI